MHTGCVPCSVLIFALLAASGVLGHGYVSKVTIDGKEYQGNTPNSDTFPSPIRGISDTGPVKTATNLFLSCGLNAQKAALEASALPGSEVKVFWSSGVEGKNWIHKAGPMMMYMSRCNTPASSDCTTFDASSARWFKIDEVGLRPNGSGWGMENLYNGFPAVVRLPATLAPGSYLLRHELIALHNAMAPGGAEFYPSCTQLRVGGNETGVPDPAAANEMVGLPGAYTDTDPGILFDAYDMGSSAYVFPGPPIAILVEQNNAQAVADDGDSNSTVVGVPGTKDMVVGSNDLGVGGGSYRLLIYPRRVSVVL